jgi:acetyltransferase-like isoleucine patch superfamily enzyme
MTESITKKRGEGVKIQKGSRFKEERKFITAKINVMVLMQFTSHVKLKIICGTNWIIAPRFQYIWSIPVRVVSVFIVLCKSSSDDHIRLLQTNDRNKPAANNSSERSSRPSAPLINPPTF